MWTSNQRNGRKFSSSTLPGDENFDFSTWAQLVRQQMMSALQKRQRNT
ncbi:MAG: hypothetical protein VKL39_17615 [Leptolyngbyaceae bacterium]|nr:hypothetical protein [Leptolyngbyaceae bacterium]